MDSSKNQQSKNEKEAITNLIQMADDPQFDHNLSQVSNEFTYNPYNNLYPHLTKQKKDPSNSYYSSWYKSDNIINRDININKHVISPSKKPKFITPENDKTALPTDIKPTNKNIATKKNLPVKKIEINKMKLPQKVIKDDPQMIQFNSTKGLEPLTNTQDFDTNSAPYRMYQNRGFASNIVYNSTQNDIQLTKNLENHENGQADQTDDIKYPVSFTNKGLTTKVSEILDKYNVFNTNKKLLKKQKKLSKQLKEDSSVDYTSFQQKGLLKNNLINPNYHQHIMAELKKAEIATQAKFLIDLSQNSNNNDKEIQEFTKKINQIFNENSEYKSHPCLNTMPFDTSNGLPNPPQKEESQSSINNNNNPRCLQNYIQKQSDIKNKDIMITRKLENSKINKLADRVEIESKNNALSISQQNNIAKIQMMKKGLMNNLNSRRSNNISYNSYNKIIDQKYLTRRFDGNGNNRGKSIKPDFYNNRMSRIKRSKADVSEMNKANMKLLKDNIKNLNSGTSTTQFQKIINSANGFNEHG